MQDAGCRGGDAGCRMKDAGCRSTDGAGADAPQKPAPSLSAGGVDIFYF